MTRLFPADGSQRVFPVDNARLLPSDGDRVGPIPLPENMGLLTGVYETLARDSAASRGVLLTSSGSAHTKGTYVELVASSSANAVGILVQGHRADGNRQYMMDLAIGAAASEVIIAANLAFYGSGAGMGINQYFIPLAIPSGTRIAARVQNADNGASDLWICASLLLEDDSVGLAICDTWGAVEASTIGARITPSATIDTKGSWGEIIDGTPNDVTIISIAQLQFDTGLASNSNLFDIGIGPSGSEEVIIADLPFECNTNNDFQNGTIPFYPIDIPSGSRISARSACSAASTPDGSIFDLIIYGYK